MEIEYVEPIFELTVKCERLYTEQILRLNGKNKTNDEILFREVYQRFVTWAAFLGVFAESEVCLDRRLRRHIKIQEQLIRLLDIIERNLTFSIEPIVSPSPSYEVLTAPVFEADSSLDATDAANVTETTVTADKIEIESSEQLLRLDINLENLEAISEAVERLNHIGVAIRRSSVMSQATKARRFTEMFNLSSFDEIAYFAIKTMYTTANEGLLELLTRSMVETYSRFLRCKSRHKTLKAPELWVKPMLVLNSDLVPISEGPAPDVDSDPGGCERLDPQISQSGTFSTVTPPQPPPQPLQIPGRTLYLENTSIDVQEFRAKSKDILHSSVKGSTKSILVNQMNYPRPAQGSQTCNWCFDPLPTNVLEEEFWRTHVNEAHEPYICISEKCSQSLSRFANEHQWLEHMQNHGQNWYREVYAPLSWICPMCDDNGSTLFFTPGQLTSHLTERHDETFTDSQIQVIVRQSRIRSPRPRNLCPLCCFSVGGQQEPTLKKSRINQKEPTNKRPFSDNTSYGSLRRIKTDTGHTDLGQHTSTEEQQKQQGPNVQSLPPTEYPTDESIASHIAGHLRNTMLLTLRMILIDVPMNMSADCGAVSNDANYFSSQIEMSERGSDISDQESDSTTDGLLHEDIPADSPSGNNYHTDEVPDSEIYFDWKNAWPDDKIPVEDKFLQEVINSGAFQTSVRQRYILKERMTSIDGKININKIPTASYGFFDSHSNEDNVKCLNEWTPLHSACDSGHFKIVRLLLDRGADLLGATNIGWTPLHSACDSGHFRIVQLLLKRGANLSVATNNGWTPFYSACLSGHNEIMHLLLRSGADPNAQDGYYGNALQVASYSGNQAIVRLLLQYGADINTYNGYYGNALQAASYSGHRNIVWLLLQSGADSNAQYGYYGNALQAACYSGHEDIVLMLLECGADPNAQDGYYGNALQAASYSGHQAIVRMLLKSGADPNAQDGYYGNALQAASYSGHQAIVQQLLQAGADLYTHNGKYDNALQAACYGGHQAIVKLLLYNTELNTQDRYCNNALQAASYSGHQAIVQLLLDYGIDINIQCGYYGNALQAACYSGHEDIVQLLLQSGADLNAQDKYHGNALQAASYSGHQAIVQQLLQAGADLYTHNEQYNNAPQAALYSRHQAIVQLLLDNSAHANIQGRYYDNALQAASYSGPQAIVQLLLDRGADENAQGGEYGNTLHYSFQAGPSTDPRDSQQKPVDTEILQDAVIRRKDGMTDCLCFRAYSSPQSWVSKKVLAKNRLIMLQEHLECNCNRTIEWNGIWPCMGKIEIRWRGLHGLQWDEQKSWFHIVACSKFDVLFGNDIISSQIKIIKD